MRIYELEGYESQIQSGSLSRDENRIVVVLSKSSILIQNMKSSKRIHELEDDVSSVSISSGGNYVVSGGESIHIWNTKSGKDIDLLGVQRYAVIAVISVSFPPDDKYISLKGP